MGREWTRPEGGVGRPRTNKPKEGGKKNGDPELGSRLGPQSPAWGNFAGEERPGDRSRDVGTPWRPSTGTSGVFPSRGKDWAGSRQRVAEPGAAAVRMRTSGAAEDSGGWGDPEPEPPGAPRSAGEGPPLGSSQTTPGPP